MTGVFSTLIIGSPRIRYLRGEPQFFSLPRLSAAATPYLSLPCNSVVTTNNYLSTTAVTMAQYKTRLNPPLQP